MLGLPTKEELEDIGEREMVDVTPPVAPPKLEEFTQPKEPPKQALESDETPPEPNLIQQAAVVRRRGRPPGSRNAQKAPEPTEELDPAPIEPLPDYELDPEGALAFEATTNLLEWFGNARTRLREMIRANMTPKQFESFRQTYSAPMLRLKNEYSSCYQQLDGLIKMGEQ